MMTKRDIQIAILGRIKAIEGSCNSYYHNYTDGTIRGLIWALTGKDHLINESTTADEILTLAEIPYRKEGDQVHFDLEIK